MTGMTLKDRLNDALAATAPENTRRQVEDLYPELQRLVRDS